MTDIKILQLYLEDYRKKLHVREIARRLKKSHSVILPYLNRLVKEKIMRFEIIGKNKEYYLNLDNLQTKNALVNAEIKKNNEYLRKNFLLKKINDEIAKLNLNCCIILFGSYVKGYFTKSSDIDLFIVKDLTKKKKKKIKEIGELYKKEINIHNLSLNKFTRFIHSNEPLAKEIIKYHILLDNASIFVNILWEYFQ